MIRNEQIVDVFWKSAEEMMLAHGSIDAIVVLIWDIIKGAEVMPIYPIMAQPNGQNILKARLQEVVTEDDSISSVLMVFNAWSMDPTRKQGKVQALKPVTLENNPDLIEQLVLTMECRSGYHLVRTANVIRDIDDDDKVISIANYEDCTKDGISGGLFGVFPVLQ